MTKKTPTPEELDQSDILAKNQKASKRYQEQSAQAAARVVQITEGRLSNLEQWSLDHTDMFVFLDKQICQLQDASYAINQTLTDYHGRFLTLRSTIEKLEKKLQQATKETDNTLQ